jgi:hypothetical protein
MTAAHDILHLNQIRRIKKRMAFGMSAAEARYCLGNTVLAANQMTRRKI